MSLTEIRVPDIGTDSADLIEWLVQPGQAVAVDAPLAVLESAKASMEVPAPTAGMVRELKAAVGDKLSQGSLLLVLEVQDAAGVIAAPAPAGIEATQPADASRLEVEVVAVPTAPTPPSSLGAVPVATDVGVHAGPAVRRLARELGAGLGRVTGTGPRGRILKEDVHAWVKQQLERPMAVPTGPVVAELPVIDFSRWGEVESLPLTKIQRVSAENLHRAWRTIPHVTQFDDADITELERFRLQEKDGLKAQGVSLTLLSFLVMACARVLRAFPRFNSSLVGEALVLKRYIHIGIAVDTPNGLVVPVLRDADRKSLTEIARELGELSTKARDKKLTPAEMQGGTFSISSLGGIGGTAFTPIVNWPEVAILGVSRSALKPVWDGQSFQPRLMLPLSLSYDHRVIDGAEAARFSSALVRELSDIRRLLL